MLNRLFSRSALQLLFSKSVRPDITVLTDAMAGGMKRCLSMIGNSRIRCFCVRGDPSIIVV